MRRFIFKDEIIKVFLENGISEIECNKITNCLFFNISDLDSSKQYFLNDDFTNIAKIETKLNALSKNQPLIQSIKKIFIVDDDLHIPLDLKNKILKNEPIAVFIGAGVSKLINYPLWGELADNAIRFLSKNNLIDYFEEQRLLYEIKDPKQKLSIFDKFCDKKSPLAKKFYMDNLSREQIQNNPYDEIVSEEFNWLKMTSNIDYELRDAMARVLNSPKVISSAQQNATPETKEVKIISSNFDPSSIQSDALYYLHGELNMIEDVIFTTEDYIKNYFSDNGTIRRFLKEVFTKYTVIFIGYGLEEFPILDRILEQTNKHYALMSTYLNEMHLFKIKEKYFNSLNVSIIPYYLDFEGYSRLLSVLRKWKEEIKDSRIQNTQYYPSLDKIDEVL